MARWWHGHFTFLPEMAAAETAAGERTSSPWPMISIAEANRISLMHTDPLPAMAVPLAQSLVWQMPKQGRTACPRSLSCARLEGRPLGRGWTRGHASSRPFSHVRSHSTAAGQGRVLAEDVMAQEPIPAVRTSIMDGYAVVAGDGAGDFDIVGGAVSRLPFCLASYSSARTAVRATIPAAIAHTV